ncbi:hypothetical protein HDU83_007777 [Entophlyctis luteolus]|nr:hypothetical protein HDU83_007777 [Entophlyctis luteolus]
MGGRGRCLCVVLPVRHSSTASTPPSAPSPSAALISPPALRRIAATTLLSLLEPLSTPGATHRQRPPRAVAVVSPHPGAVSVLDRAVDWSAAECNAKIVSLDYLSIIERLSVIAASSSEEPHHNFQGSSTDSSSAQPPDEASSQQQIAHYHIIPSVPFSPSAYALTRDLASTSSTAASEGDEYAEDEDDDDLDDENDDEYGDHRSNSPTNSAEKRAAAAVRIFGGVVKSNSRYSGLPARVVHHHHHHQTFPVTVKVVVDGKVENKENYVAESNVANDFKPVARPSKPETVNNSQSSSYSNASLEKDNVKSDDTPIEDRQEKQNKQPRNLKKTSRTPGRVRVNISSDPNQNSDLASFFDIWDPMSYHLRRDPEMSHYGLRLRSTHIEKVMSMLRQEITNLEFADGADKRVVLWYRDLTDTLQVSGESGKRVIAGLLNLTQTLRKEDGIAAALVVGCTPALMDLVPDMSEAVSDAQPSSHFEIFDDEKFARMVSGNETVIAKDWMDDEEADSDSNSEDNIMAAGFNLASSGQMYASVVDRSPHIFEKIEVAPIFTEPATSQDERLVSRTYIQDARESLNRRHREINWRLILLHARQRRVRIPGINMPEILDPPPTVIAGLPAGLLPLSRVLMGHSIWSLERVRKTVGIAVGLQMLSSGRIGTAAENVPQLGSVATSDLEVVVGLKHLVEALNVIKDETWGCLVDAATRVANAKLIEAESVTSDQPDGSDKAVRGNGGKGKDDGGGGVGIVDQVEAQAKSDNAVQSSSESPVVPMLTVQTNTSPSNPAAESTESSIIRLKRELRKNGYKLNSYETKMLSTVVTPASISVGFGDLILPAPTKLMLQTLVTLPLMRPDLFSSGILAKHSIAGVLLFGPPGTGKTLLAKAAAKSSGANFMSVALSDIFDKYVGEGEKNVRAVFTLARKLSPCVVFIDEVDALFGARRGGDGVTSSKREIINEFMSEWDGLNSRNRGVIVLGATNRPFDLDDAVLRRMPRRVLVDLPTEEQRKEILRVHLQDEVISPEVSLADLASRTKLYSGSDLKNLCISAALASVKEALYREAAPLQESGDGRSLESTAEVLKRLEGLDDWRSVLQNKQNHAAAAAPASTTTPRVIFPAHFDVALREVPPSLTDEMQTLIELRKWDENYGDSGGRKKPAKKGWGFDAASA